MSIASKSRNQHRLCVVVIGGGATGTGIARQAAEQGFEVVLVERGDLGSGTSSRFHGVLHSGARYAVADPTVAALCYQENRRLRRLIPQAITDTGGLFVALNDAESAHADVLLQACQQAGIPTKEINRATALRREPELNPALQRAITVPDGFIEGAVALQLNRQAAEATGKAEIITNHRVRGVRRSGSTITSVTIQSLLNGASQDIACDYVVNAAGVWAGQIAELASIKLEMLFDKGTMIIFKQQLSSAVINRCRPENDGDLLVPHNGTSIMGTTSRIITDPDDYLPTQEEADVLVREGTLLMPALAHTEALKIYAGVRPLQASADPKAQGRSLSRAFNVIDHQDQGVNNFISVVGGKVTLFRLMAEAAVELLASKKA